MVSEIKEASDKKLKIVFENKNSCTHTIADHVYSQHKAKLESEPFKKALVQKKYEEIMDFKIDDDYWAELQGPTEYQNRRLREIATAVKMANQRENLGTDKFLQDVESMVTVFKPEFDKMQKLFGSILKKLPQVKEIKNYNNLMSLPQVHNVPLT